jgi:hypothetical protein
MKKLYFSLISMALCGSVVSQTTFNMENHMMQKGQIDPHSRIPQKNQPTGDRSAPFNTWFEVIGDVMTNKGLDLTGTTPDQDYFLDVVNCDSTVQVSSSTSTRSVSDILLGTVLDPKSSFLDASLYPLVTNTEPYYIDSIAVLGSYVQVDPSVTDTLYTWVVWGDSSSTSTVFKKRLTSSIWVSPISTWRYEIIGPKISGYGGAAGNKVKASAPASNMVLIKYVLTAADVATGAGYSNYIFVPLPYQLSIPAGNIVSCFYTFVPGATPTVGAVSYSFTGGAPQEVNGFAGMIWAQNNPAVTAVSDYQDHQVDPTSWNMGVTYSKEQRHAVYPASYINSMWGDLVTGPVVLYHVNNVSTGVNENGYSFNLIQNYPNPFNETTSIHYELSKPASNVIVEVYDITGVKVFESTDSNLKTGKHSVDLNNVNFTPGVYFYSLTVDGAKITKKMIAQ